MTEKERQGEHETFEDLLACMDKNGWLKKL